METYFYHPQNDNSNNNQRYHFQHYSSSPHPHLQNHRSNTTSPETTKEKDLFLKRILIVDDDPDLTLTFKMGLDGYYYDDKRRFEVYTYNNPAVALSNFNQTFTI